MNPSLASLNLFSSSPSQVPDEHLLAFHLHDRKLYQILVHDLQRDPLESINVMGFLMWLERKVWVGVNLIYTLLELPYNLVNEVADETVICLLCCLFQEFPFPDTVFELAVLPNLAHPNVVAKKLVLRDFHYDRVRVVFQVNKMVKEVCCRAFRDIVPGTHSDHQINIFTDKGKAVDSSANVDGFPQPVFDFPLYQPSNAGMFFGHQIAAPGGAVNIQQFFPGIPVAHARRPQRYDPLSNIFGRLSVNNEEVNMNDVLPEDRTIFITFSKGYPASEAELRDFFTRKFGNFIEAIYMQDVPPYQQVLYARIVSRSAATVDLVVQGGRAKYNIFGKQVWARKY